MKNFLTFLIAVQMFGALGQHWDWVNYTQGGGSNHTYYDIEVTNDQNFILGAGRYRATATFYGQDTNVVNPLFSGNRDVFLTKIDTNGNYEWVVTDGGSGNDFAEGITTDEYDNIYVVGTTSDSAFFGNIGISSGPVGSGAVLVAKYDPNGNIIWVKSWDGDSWDFAKEVECDKQGNIYVAGYQSGNFVYGNDTLIDKGYFVMKLNYNGDIIWCKGPVNQSSSGYSVANSLELHDNKLYFGGRVKSDVEFDAYTINAPTWDDMFFAKMDTSGTIEFVRSGGGIYYADCQDIAISDSNIYVVGSYSGTANFGGITVVSNTSGSGGQDAFNSRDAFIAKYNLDGTSCEWIVEEKSLLLDVNYNILIDKSDNLVVTGGYVEDNIYSQTISEGDLKIKSYNQNGVLQWELFPTGLRKAEGIVMKEDNYGNYYFGGRIKGDYTFNSNIFIPVPGGKFTAAIGKIYPPLEVQDHSIAGCTSDSVILAVSNQFGHPLNYYWYDNNGLIASNTDSIIYHIMNTDTITYIVSNGYESDTGFYFVQENTLPYFSLGNDTTICTSSPSLLLQTLDNYDSYVWNSDSNESSFQYHAIQSGDYWLEVTDSNGCKFSDSIYVLFHTLPPIDLGNDISICHTQDSIVIGTSDDPSTIQYQWLGSFPDTSHIYVSSSGMYSLTVTDTNNCQNVDSIIVDLLALPSINIGSDTSICEGTQPFVISVSPDYYQYQWSTGPNDTTNTISVYLADTYSLTVSDTNGCSQTDSIVLSINQLPVIDLGDDTTTCDYNQFITLNAPQGFNAYSWSSDINDTLSSINVQQSGIYYVTVTDVNNCSNTDSVEVIFIDCTGIDEENNAEVKLSLIDGQFILIDTKDDIFEIRIYNTSGQLIRSEFNKNRIDFKSANSGLFIVQYLGSKTLTKKMILK